MRRWKSEKVECVEPQCRTQTNHKVLHWAFWEHKSLWNEPIQLATPTPTTIAFRISWEIGCSCPSIELDDDAADEEPSPSTTTRAFLGRPRAFFGCPFLFIFAIVCSSKIVIISSLHTTTILPLMTVDNKININQHGYVLFGREQHKRSPILAHIWRWAANPYETIWGFVNLRHNYALKSQGAVGGRWREKSARVFYISAIICFVLRAAYGQFFSHFRRIT